jgi:hypothetical protein
VEGRVVRRSGRRKLLRSAGLRSRCAVMCAVLLAAVFLPTPSWADGIDPVNCDEHPTAPQCIVDVITVGGGSSGGASGVTQCHDIDREVAPCYIQKYGWNDGGDGCYYKPASQSFVDAYGAPPPPAAWYEGWCGNVRTGFSFLTRMRIFANPPGQGLLVSAGSVAAAAAAAAGDPRESHAPCRPVGVRADLVLA